MTSEAVGPPWFPGQQMTALSYQEGRREKSLSSPWKSIVKTVLHYPSRDFHAIPSVIKRTEAITLHQHLGKWTSVLGEMEKRVMFIHPPLLETELHVCVHGKGKSCCCSTGAEGGGMRSCFLCQILISLHM